MSVDAAAATSFPTHYSYYSTLKLVLIPLNENDSIEIGHKEERRISRRRSLPLPPPSLGWQNTTTTPRFSDDAEKDNSTGKPLPAEAAAAPRRTTEFRDVMLVSLSVWLGCCCGCCLRASLPRVWPRYANAICRTEFATRAYLRRRSGRNVVTVIIQRTTQF